MTKRYHCFYMNPYGNERKYVAHDDLPPVLDLVKKSNIEDEAVVGLKVVYGELLEFEPATYVETYRIKETQ